MTRKDFELIADALAAARPRPDNVLVHEHNYIAKQLAAKLRSTNPNFDSARFLRACGVPNAG